MPGLEGLAWAFGTSMSDSEDLEEAFSTSAHAQDNQRWQRRQGGLGKNIRECKFLFKGIH